MEENAPLIRKSCSVGDNWKVHSIKIANMVGVVTLVGLYGSGRHTNKLTISMSCNEHDFVKCSVGISDQVNHYLTELVSRQLKKWAWSVGLCGI